MPRSSSRSRRAAGSSAGRGTTCASRAGSELRCASSSPVSESPQMDTSTDMNRHISVSVAGVVAAALLAGCNDKPKYTAVPANTSFSLGLAMKRLRDAGLRVSIRRFPRNPCGVGLDGYFVVNQSPRAPARVKRGSTVVVRLVRSPIPSPAVEDVHPKFAVVPDLVGRRYSDAMNRIVGMWPCIDDVQPLTASPSSPGLEPYV